MAEPNKADKADNDNQATVSNIRNDIIRLDMTPSCTPNVSVVKNISNNLLWICSMCSCSNDALLDKCEICDSDLTNQCEWLQESISTNNINNNNISSDTKTEMKEISDNINNKPTRSRKRQRTYTDNISQPKKQKLSNDKMENENQQDDVKNQYDGNINFIQETEQKIMQKYKEREEILKQEHYIHIQRLGKEIKGLQQENALLFAQNIKYETTQLLLQTILNDNNIQTHDVAKEDVIMHDNNHNIPAQLSPIDYGSAENKKNENNCVIEKQFQCQYCPKRFKTISHRNYHELTHNTAIQYECKPCRAQFTRKEYHLQHLKTKKHKDKVTEKTAKSTTSQYSKEQKKDANNEIDF